MDCRAPLLLCACTGGGLEKNEMNPVCPSVQSRSSIVSIFCLGLLQVVLQLPLTFCMSQIADVTPLYVKTIYIAFLVLEIDKAAQDSKTQLSCFKRLAEQEERTLPLRLDAAKARLARQVEREQELQEKYKQKSLLRDDLTVKLAVLDKLQACSQ